MQSQEPKPEAGAAPNDVDGRSWPSLVIIAIGVAWVLYIGSRELDQLRSGFSVASPAWLTYSVLAGIVGLLLSACLFGLLLRFHSGVSIGFTYAARLMFVGQVLRHLPGRVWGILYLVNETSAQVAPAAMIRANVELLGYSLAFNILVAMTLFSGVTAGVGMGLLVALAGFALATISLRADWLGRLIRFLLRFAPSRLSRSATISEAGAEMGWAGAFQISGLFVLMWCAYLTVWWAFAQTFPALDGINIWLLCASYSIAWVAGYLSALTPAGLGVREAGFFALASSVTSLSNLTFLAVFIRLWQVGLDLLLFALFFFVKPSYGPASGSPRPLETKAL